MAKQQDRGTKREDPETGKKFYDLNKDPIISPYTGKTYPRSYFEQPVVRSGRASPAAVAVEEEEEKEVEKEEVVDEAAPVIVSLEEADAEESGEDDDIPDVEDVEDVEDIGDDDADVFLEEEDEDEDDAIKFDVDSGDER